MEQRPTFQSSRKSSSMNDPSRYLDPEQIPTRLGRSSFPEFSLPLDNQSQSLGYSSEEPTPFNQVPNWDPRAMLANLSFLEQKIHQVQDIIRSTVNREDQLAAQQQLVNADLTSILIQLISTASGLLPSINNTLLASNPTGGQLSSIIGSHTTIGFHGTYQESEGFSSQGTKVTHRDELIRALNDYGGLGGEKTEPIPIEDHDVKDSEDGMDCENLPPGSYEILQLEKEEILAPHTHFCTICGKGFKRDANLRMHMRGHGDEYKTPSALAKPCKEPNSEPVITKRYSCPFSGCKRNKEHKKFQPLKTILCMKNHYKRSHCDKSYTCSRCNSKKFSVLADLKTHEKHCGREKWLCSCGTTFSRKDKLFGHVALFQGHTPTLPVEEAKGSDKVWIGEAVNQIGNTGYSFAGSSMDNVGDLDIKGFDDDRGYFSPMIFDSCNFGGLDEFPRPAFDISEGSFSFVAPRSCSFVQKNGEDSSSGRLG